MREEHDAFTASSAFLRAERMWNACTRATITRLSDHIDFIAYFNGSVPL